MWWNPENHRRHPGIRCNHLCRSLILSGLPERPIFSAYFKCADVSGVFCVKSKKWARTNPFAADQRQILRISDDFPVRLTTKPFPGTFGSYEKGRLFFLYAALHGLSPYFVETDADLFVSEEGDVSARLEVEYSLLLTQADPGTLLRAEFRCPGGERAGRRAGLERRRTRAATAL